MPFDLSVIIPVRNEAPRIPGLIAMLARQEGIDHHLILVDGQSTDETVAKAQQHARQAGIPLIVEESPPNRAIQIQRGIPSATAPLTMILHADSRFDDPLALRKGINLLRPGEGGVRGGHFRLRFEERDLLPPRWLAFQEAKARLPRHDCIHGDQGLIFPTSWLSRQPPLPPDRPMLAETILANRMLDEGGMILLASDITTSARRFLTEGIGGRQLVNALILNAHRVGWDRFFREGLPLYREQNESGRLDSGRIVSHAVSLLEREGEKEKNRILRESGRHLAQNAWQIPLLFHLMVSTPRIPSRFPLIALYDRLCAPLLKGGVGGMVGEWLLRLWITRQLEDGASPPT